MDNSYTANELGEPKKVTLKQSDMNKETLAMIFGLIIAIAGFMTEPSSLPFEAATNDKVVLWAKFIGGFTTVVSGVVLVARRVTKLTT